MCLFYRDAEAQPEENETFLIENNESTEESSKKIKKFRSTKKIGIVQEPIVVAAVCSFATYLLQSGMESLITPFTSHFFGWEPKENAFMYTVVGLISFIGYLRYNFIN